MLATLTGIPDAVAAVRIAFQGQGAAVVSKNFNSNSLNLIAGTYLPTLFMAARPVSSFGRTTFKVVLGGAVLTTLLFLRRRALGRPGGWLLMVGYAGFTGLVIAW